MTLRIRNLAAFSILVFGLMIALPSMASTASAQSQIHAVQFPAWLIREQRQSALRAGAVLLDGDIIRTGSGGRAEIDLAEGSVVKLGENAEFQVESLVQSSDEQGGFFSGVLNVLKGAFRFTTRAVSKSNRRKLDINVGVMTAGIRGTDIWGKAGEGKDFIVLLEGAIAMTSEDHPEPVYMDKPLDAMEVPTGGSMQAMVGVDMPMVSVMALETEMAEDNAMMMMTANVRLVVMSLHNESRAAAVARNLGDIGYPAEVQAVTLASGQWYRVVVPNMATIKDARMLGAKLIGMAGVSDFWVIP